MIGTIIYPSRSLLPPRRPPTTRAPPQPPRTAPPRARTAPLNDRHDHFPIAIAQRHLRPQQIRSPDIAAAQIRAVAARAADPIQRLPARHHRRIRRHARLPRHKSTAPLPAPARRGRRRLLRKHTDRRQHPQSPAFSQTLTLLNPSALRTTAAQTPPDNSAN